MHVELVGDERHVDAGERGRVANENELAIEGGKQRAIHAARRSRRVKHRPRLRAARVGCHLL